NVLEVIQSLLDVTWENLNTGHWSEVPVEERSLYSTLSLIKVIVIIQSQVRMNGPVDESLKEALRAADLGLLLGSSLRKELSHAANLLSSALFKGNVSNPLGNGCLDNIEDKPGDWNFKGVFGELVDNLKCPSLEYFSKNHFTNKKPVKLTECINHWPALRKWRDVNYLLKVGGPRTVPVELGSAYTQSDWGMQLLTLHDFILKHIIEKGTTTGYLAQHQLFNQIPELKADIRVPEYCYLSEREEDDDNVDINAWFGPSGTVSPLHYDPKHNLLTQIVGRKRVLLYCPEDSEKLYSHGGLMLHNTAKVDPYEPDYESYPNYKFAKAYECHLYPGEMLYIPPKWWHHVRSLDVSFSVSFWWE
ncbi:hypothetical protein AAG570_003485, partial [Ranatra chinensis]